MCRECDTDSELKGSASTSLMKSIIGQQGQQKNRYVHYMCVTPVTPVGFVMLHACSKLVFLLLNLWYSLSNSAYVLDDIK